MNSKQAVASLIHYLDDKIGPPIRTSMNEDEDAIPRVVVEEWDKENSNLHNTASRGYEQDDATGWADKEVFHKYFKLRIDLKVRTANEEQAYDIMDLIEDEVMILEEEPQTLDKQVLGVTLGDTRGVTAHHVPEPSEASLMTSVKMRSFNRVTRDVDVIEQIDSNTEVIN